MIKRVVLILALLFVGMGVSDISFAARHFVEVERNMYREFSLDVNSVQVIRYNPPFYIIRADEKVKSYDSKETSITTKEYFYDFSTKEIKSRYLYATIQNFDGETHFNDYRIDRFTSQIRKVQPGGPGEALAKFAFKIAYNMDFK